MSAHWVWVVVALYWSAAWVATTWIRARYGHSRGERGGCSGWRGTGRSRTRGRDEPRDREIARLEQRVRVLERIATDRRAELLREFERLESER